MLCIARLDQLTPAVRANTMARLEKDDAVMHSDLVAIARKFHDGDGAEL